LKKGIIVKNFRKLLKFSKALFLKIHHPKLARNDDKKGFLKLPISLKLFKFAAVQKI